MDRLVDRVVEEDLSTQIAAMAMMVYSLPRNVGAADAIAVLPGLGEDWRLIDAIDAWNNNSTARHLLVAGTYEGERTQIRSTLESLSKPPFNLTRHEGVIIQPHGRADHTKEQADWLVRQVAEHGITSMALFVSPYHLLRGYCTTLKAFERNNQDAIPLIPMPAMVSPSTLIPEVGVDAWTMTHGEFERVRKYQALGDVATLGDLQEYINWLWQQPIVAQAVRRG